MNGERLGERLANWAKAEGNIPRLLTIVLVLLVVVYLVASLQPGKMPPLDDPNLTAQQLYSYLHRVNLPTSIIGLFLIFLFLATLPAWIIVNYRNARLNALKSQITDDLWLGGLEPRELEEKLKDFERRNSYWAYFWPIICAMIPLFVLWWIVLAPNGMFGLYESLFPPEFQLSGADGTTIARGFVLLRYVKYVVERSTPLTWVFLGTYFYLLGVLIRRWMRSDLSAGLLWRVNARLGISLIVGLLLTTIFFASAFPTPIEEDTNGPAPTAVATESAGSSVTATATATEAGTITSDTTAVLASSATSVPGTTTPLMAFLAFLFGIVPESAFRWLNNRLTPLLRQGREVPDPTATAEQVFRASDLHAIEGLNFWQIDRLMDDGIDNVQNLVTRDITQMLVAIRFDTIRLLDWIDQGLLIHNLGIERIPYFRLSCLHTASDLLDAIGLKETAPQPQADGTRTNAIEYEVDDAKLDRVVAALTEVKCDISKDVLRNLVTSLVHGPNYAFLRRYWVNTSSSDTRNQCLAVLDERSQDEPALTRLKEVVGARRGQDAKSSTNGRQPATVVDAAVPTI